MVSPGVKNDVKTLFLIFNTLCGGISGFFLQLTGFLKAAEQLRDPTFRAMTIVFIVVGLVLVGFALLGYYGIIKENSTMLIAYAEVMALVAVVDIVPVLFALQGYFDFMFSIQLLLLHAAMTLVAVVLAAVLAHAHRGPPQGRQGCVLSPPLKEI